MNSKERFSDRVDQYVKYRPSYSEEVIHYLYETIGFRPESVIADVGAGTGIFTRLLLEQGSAVIAVEPNPDMRKAAVDQLSGHPGFLAVSGSAEETGLADGSVDFIVCAQSFHWFDRTAAKTEFNRILKPGGKAVLIWNSRLTTGTPFLEGYDRLLRTYGIDYEKVGHKNITQDALTPFFEDGGLHKASFPLLQPLNFEQLSGRMSSSSYMPLPGHPNYEPLMEELQQLFNATEQNGIVSFDYETEIYWGEV
ncbi:methyltransferase domain-containing protein [Paenibacillus glycanilyticus]|uniref:class I SAM-dependent methyltransferase n=1 Tax=Paenibacillus glycanilyticus TaxID=126569 RepID=UPI00203D02F7|nr:class I SAM-dependent methyltransferase [Paenibacillus glycanilyticus]MCM3627162.1 methyltransferase domain-containing protein [Paenibacillus glycanilyticus]